MVEATYPEDDLEIVLILIGLVTLVAGAEGLVRGGAALAARIGISPLVVGLTVVAFGTSAPELAVSARAAIEGTDAVAVGNAVGSNIFNILAVLGISACITPLAVASRLIRIDVPIMIAVSVILLIVARDGAVSPLDGLLFLAGFVAYTGWTVFQARQESGIAEVSETNQLSLVAGAALVVGGLVALILGAGWLVDGATVVALTYGVSERVIGLTVVAAGTSLPEAATSVVASIRGQRDIAVGNVVGSNIFNILVVIGLPALLSAEGLEVGAAARGFDIPVATAVALTCLPVFLTGTVIARWEGVLFVVTYLSYTAFLVVAALQAFSVDGITAAAPWFIFPLIAIVFGHAAVQRLRHARLSQDPP